MIKFYFIYHLLDILLATVIRQQNTSWIKSCTRNLPRPSLHGFSFDRISNFSSMRQKTITETSVDFSSSLVFLKTGVKTNQNGTKLRNKVTKPLVNSFLARPQPLFLLRSVPFVLPPAFCTSSRSVKSFQFANGLFGVITGRVLGNNLKRTSC